MTGDGSGRRVVRLLGVDYEMEASPLTPVYGPDVVAAWATSGGARAEHRMHAASLALACPRLARRIARATPETDTEPARPGAGTYADHAHDIIAYGGAVLAALLARGVPFGEVMRAGNDCGLWLIESRAGTTAAEVDEAQGNS